MPLLHCKSGLINPVMAEFAPCKVSLGVSVLVFPDLSLYSGLLGCIESVNVDQDVMYVPQCWSCCIQAGASGANVMSLPYGLDLTGLFS